MGYRIITNDFSSSANNSLVQMLDHILLADQNCGRFKESLVTDC